MNLAAAHTPKFMTVPAGSFVIRDQRALHRGTPNRSKSVRPMLSLNYEPPRPTVPHHAVSDAAAFLGLRVRDGSHNRPSKPVNLEMMRLGNFLGIEVQNFAATDRNYRRKIPQEIWSAFSEHERRLLRFARVEGTETEE